MFRASCLFASVSFVLVLAGPAAATELSDARIALHLQSHMEKTSLICVPATQGGAAPTTIPCSQFVTAGRVGQAYDAYLVAVATTAEPGAPLGITGISCGIEYDAVAGRGADIFGWYRCSDLDFTTAGPNGEWPASGGSNRITWTSCQTDVVPGYASEGAIAIAGALYVYAYDPDVLAVTSNRNVELGPELVVTGCDGAELDLPFSNAGSIQFSADGSVSGCNPCLGPCEFSEPCLVSSGSLDFGSVAIGESVDRNFTVQNTSTQTITGEIIVACPEYSVITGGGPFTLDPGTTLPVTVRFTPSGEGTRYCLVAVGRGCSTVTCVGVGLVPCEMSTSLLEFWYKPIGMTTTNQFTVTNNRTSTLDLELSLSSTDSDFALLEEGPHALAPGETASFGVAFTPSQLGMRGAVVLLGDAACGDLTCRGYGLPADAPTCAVSPIDLDFGATLAGTIAVRSFTIYNDGASAVTGTVRTPSAPFFVTEGAGLFSLPPGEYRKVTVEFRPTMAGIWTAPIDVGVYSGPVMATGGGIQTASPCGLSATRLAYGAEIGSSKDYSLTITNPGASIISGVVSLSTVTGEFSITVGAGPYSLSPGQSRMVTVRFSPSRLGYHYAILKVADSCPTVECSGNAIPAQPRCEVDPSLVYLGFVPIGSRVQGSTTITNVGGGLLKGTVTTRGGGGEFAVLAGATAFSLGAGQSRTVIVEYRPTMLGNQTFIVEFGDFSPCEAAIFQARGVAPLGTQANAAIALHLSVPAEENACSFPDIPCSQFTTSGAVGQGYQMYAVVTHADSLLGIAGAAFGIHYDGVPHRGIDIPSWTSCADLESPGGGWPGSGGGNLLTWASDTNCQRRIVGSDGVYAVLGSFYLYAYGPDTLTITPRMYVSAPDLQVLDCYARRTTVDSDRLGLASFTGDPPGGGGGNPVPVRLLAFSARRGEAGAMLRWEIAGGPEDQLGFLVYRDELGSTRERLTPAPLTSGGTAFEFLDPAPPAGEVRYWLEALSRAGESEWLGPAVLLPGEQPTPFAVIRAGAHPASGRTMFVISGAFASEVTVRIYSVGGRELAMPFQGTPATDPYTVVWDGRDETGALAPSGVYLYRAVSTRGFSAGKFVLVRD